jgi:predicted metal-dependent hydrolase
VSRRQADEQLSLFAEPTVSADFEVRSSRRARRLSIRVFPHGRVEVVVPPRTPAAEVRRFVAGHRAWIDRTLEEMAATAAATDLALPGRVEFRAADESWLIARRNGPRLRLTSRASPGGGVVTLAAPESDDGVARQKLRACVVDQGRRLLLPRLSLLAERHGLVYRRAGVGRQKTRWGSCSSAGHIRLNCSLLFIPLRLADYVMLHELSHLRILDHSPRFWKLLDSMVADARALDAEMSRAWSQVPGWLFYGD